MILINFSFLIAFSFCQTSFNFPMEIGQTNTIYLKEYLPIDLQAPIYQMTSQNEFNLQIEQSLLLLQQQSTTGFFKIRCASNYIVEYGTNTNVFWILTESNELYQGLILEDGSLEITLTSIQIEKQNCFNINLLNINQGLFTCEQSNNNFLTFLLVNISNSEIRVFNTTQYINIYLGSVSTYITQNNSILSVVVVNVQSSNVIVYTCNILENQFNFFNQINFEGNYNQALVSEQQNYLFLLGSEQIDIVNFNSNFSKSYNFQNVQFQNMAIYQFSENIFQIALYQPSLLMTFITDVKITKRTLNIQKQVLSDSSSLVYLGVHPSKIFIVTNQFIAQLINDQQGQLVIEHYLNLYPINFALINENRQIIVIFGNNYKTSQTTISSYYFNQPQIKISSNLSLQISQQFSDQYSIEFTITSGLTLQEQQILILQIIPVNQTASTCPITFKNLYLPITLEYPDQMIIPYKDIFIGPNITRKVQLSDEYVIGITMSETTLYQQQQQSGFAMFSICANLHNIPIYCSQFTNKTLMVQQWIQASQSFSINASSILQHCSCYCDEKQLTVLFSFSKSILIQKFDEFFQPIQQLQFQSNQTISSSYLFQNQLFLVRHDGSLVAYDIKLNNQTLLFQIDGLGLRSIFANYIAYPNFLFLDNGTNLLIIYQNEYNYQIINQIPYPRQNYSSSAFGILRNGIFLSIEDSTTSPYSFLYYYPKQYLFFTQQNPSFLEYNMMGFTYLSKQIISAYSSKHYYILLKNSNNQCYYTILSESGSPFATFEFQNILSTNLLQISAVESISQGQDFVAGLSNQGTILYGTNMMGNYQISSFFSSSNLNNATLFYIAKNSGCTNISVSQNFTVTQNKNFITSKLFNSQLQNISFNTNSSFQIQPQQLFYGNIQSYNITCDQCKSFSYQTPTQNSSFITVNITYQTASQLGDILYIQDNQSLYYLDNETQLIKIYDFPESYPTCNSLFFEMLSNFPVSICHNSTKTAVFAFNTSSNEILTNKSLQIQNFFKSNYNNGILQIISKQQISKICQNQYFSYYVWISQSTINFQPIFQTSKYSGCVYINFVYLSMSQNFSSSPCQVFGASLVSMQNGQNPEFFLLQSCVPSFISQIFGFPPNTYDEIANIYSHFFQWRLSQTFRQSFIILSDVLQIGEGKTIGANLLQTLFFVPCFPIPIIFCLTFNFTNGLLIDFRKQSKLFVELEVYYYSFWSSTGLLVTIEELTSTNLIISIYPPLSQSTYQQEQTVQMIGAFLQNASFQNSNISVQGDYYLSYGSDVNTTIILKIQNYLSIIADLGENESAQMMITANNYFGSSSQTLYLTNLDFVPPIPNPQPLNPESDDQTSHVILISSIAGGMIVVALIGILIFKHIQKTKSQNNFNLENFVELR